MDDCGKFISKIRIKIIGYQTTLPNNMKPMVLLKPSIIGCIYTGHAEKSVSQSGIGITRKFVSGLCSVRNEPKYSKLI